MQCFVRDAEAKQAGNGMIRQWVSDIRDIAYDAEDVLDKYMIDVIPNRRQGLFTPIQKFNPYRKVKEKFCQYRIGNEIEALKRRLSDVSRRSKSYGLQNIISDKRELENNDLKILKQLRRALSFAVEENPVGFEDDTKILLGKLFNEEQRRFVISIYDMGGLGKTTLAKKIYHKSEVKNKFGCLAWASVSQDYKTQDFLLRIIKSFNIISKVDLEHLVYKSEEDLERLLFESFQGKSYLMVLDDIWRKEDWESLRKSFPNDNNGSRVIITTRTREVAELSDEKTYVHKLRFLSEDESLGFIL